LICETRIHQRIHKSLTFYLFHNVALLIFCAPFWPVTTCGLQVGTSTKKEISAFIDSVTDIDCILAHRIAVSRELILIYTTFGGTYCFLAHGHLDKAVGCSSQVLLGIYRTTHRHVQDYCSIGVRRCGKPQRLTGIC